ncbi:MAG TPA: (d)CMP kinase [Alphaproteobacteria bacterium]|nr:(d)CMP kinase [Alphaproteobacteria bacterium]
MIITIDGPAAAGKGTVSKVLSEKYKLAYFDTGMIYRAVGLEVVLKGLNPENEIEALNVAKSMTFEKMMELSKNPDFRTDIGGQAASKVSAINSVRQALLKMQQDFALSPVFADGTKANGVIYDGRDTGTVVCPHADIKFFVTASTEVRAMRRFKEFEAKGIQTTYEKVLEDMIARDKRDSERKSAPMKPAVDAILMDTSDMDAQTEINAVLKIVEEKIKAALKD